MSGLTRRQFVIGAAGAGLLTLTGAPWIWTSRKSRVYAQAVTRSFIGAEGFGAQANGWRDPSAQILFVTNLNESGAGSFKAAYQSTGPRYIIFRVAGYVVVTQPTNFGNVLGNFGTNQGNVYVAGQTAPGQGITFRFNTQTNANADGLYVMNAHTCMRYVRARNHADSGSNSWGLGFWRQGAHEHAIIDHCSISFATDDSLACNFHMSTVQKCLISEGLSRGDGNHARGALFDSHNAVPLYSIHHSAFMHAGVQRFPAMSSGLGGECVNNLVYNWGGDGVGAGAYFHNVFNVSPSPKWDCVNNLYKWGPTSNDNGGGGDNAAFGREIISGYTPCTIYVSGNKAIIPTTGYINARTGSEPSPPCTSGVAKAWVPNWPVTVDDLSTSTLGNAWAAAMLADVGCSRPARDGIDTAVIASYDAFTGDSTTAHENQCLWALQNGGNPWTALDAGTADHLSPSGMTDEFITRMGLANTTESALSTSISQARGLGEDYQNIEWNLMEKAGDIAQLEGVSGSIVRQRHSGKVRSSGGVRF